LSSPIKREWQDSEEKFALAFIGSAFFGLHVLQKRTAMTTRRLKKELGNISDDPNLGIGIITDGDNIFKWHVTFTGPPKTPYCCSDFLLELQFTTAYPFEPPTVVWLTLVHHPQFIVHSNLHIHKDDWQPMFTVKHVIDRLREVLTLPESEIACNERTSLRQEYLEDEDKFLTEAAKFHNFDQEVTPEVLVEWKAQQQVVRREVHWRPIKNRIRILSTHLKTIIWTPQRHWVFQACPAFHQVVMTVMCIHTYNYGARGCLLGIPTPLVHDILRYVAWDFLDDANLTTYHLADGVTWSRNLKTRITEWNNRLASTLYFEQETPFHVFVKPMSTPPYQLEVSASTTVDLFFQEVSRRQSIQVRLIYNGKLLQRGRTCSDYGMKEGDTVHAVMSLRCSHLFWGYSLDDR
jgi:ubiquitin-protein ligase